MRLKVLFPLCLCALVAAIVIPVRSQNQQDGQRVIDEFTRTRGSDFAPREKPVKPKRVRPAPQSAAKSAPKKTAPVNKPVEGNVPSESDSEARAAPEAAIINANLSPIGLGYTILRYQPETDELITVAPGAVFKTGDQLRVKLETNADGYLYIFNTENDSKPEMLYPNVGLDSGRNKISAHTLELYPADAEQFFRIEGEAATERLYIIFSRTPLPDVPSGEALQKLCSGNSDDCDWYPTSAQWEKIKSLAAGTQVVEGRNSEMAKVEIRVPSKSLSRSIKVRPKAPGPAVVRMSAFATADVLLTTIEIIHQ